MEYIFLDDVKVHILELKKYVRPVGITEHPTLFEGGIRGVDFVISEDKKWVLPSLEHGLSFATNMKKLKSIYKLKARRFQEVDIYAIDDLTPLPPNMRIIRDRPGHASLVVTTKISVEELIKNLEIIANRAEHIGRIKVSLC